MLKKSSLMFLMLSVILMIQNTNSQCNEGCIKCGTDSTGATACEVCDLFSSFYMDETNACVRREIENCLIPSSNQREYLCAQCIQGYILDPAATKCVEVPSTNVVSNCRQYTLSGTCKQCYQHYYLDGNTCEKASVEIENCASYFGDDLCEECVNDYYFDVDTNKCVSFEPIENCGKHSFLTCHSCLSGFYKNPNNTYLGTLDLSSVQKIATSYWEGGNFSTNWSPTCFQSTDENCFEMEQTVTSGKLTNSCKTCNNGYYLENGSCVANPGCKINNCKIYSSMEICAQCEDSHYLDCNECKERSTVDNCSILDWFQNQCFRCLDTHVLVGGVCTARTNGAITECSKYTRTIDTCETCNENFFLTIDQIDCFATIPNCDTYNLPVYKADGFMTCDDCDSTYYKTQDLKQCNKQNVLNCSTYDSTDGNKCATCELDYYLDGPNNQCILREIDNCAVPTLNLNKCTNCENLYEKITDSVNNTDTCVAINIPDCLTNTLNSNNCSECVPHRFLQNDGTRDVCVAVVESLEIKGCESSNSTDSKIGCTMCSEYSVAPISFNNKHIKNNPNGCVDYSQSSNKCFQCADDMDQSKDPNTGNITCLPAADTSVPCLFQRSETGKHLAVNYGTCSKCRNYSTHYKHDYTCWERNATYIANCLTFEEELEGCLTCKEGYSAVEGDVTDAPVCLTTPTGFAAITGCVTYNVWDSTKCVKCDWGYHLTNQSLCVLQDATTYTNEPTNYYDSDDKEFVFSNPTSARNFDNGQYSINTNNSGKSKNISKCEDGKILVVQNKFLGYNFMTKGIFADGYTGFCVNQTNWAQKDDGNGGKTPYVTSTDCELAYEKDDTLFCLKCKNNMNAKFLAAKYDFEGTDISANEYTTVEGCTTAADTLILSKKYKALGFRQNDNQLKKDFFEFEIQYDSCPDVDQNLVVIMTQPAAPFESFKVSAAQTSGVERNFCYDFGSSTIVENCYVYGVEHNPDLTTNYYTETKFCISCKPGYRASAIDSSDGRKITTCTQIDNCDVSDPLKNTWLNGCETCMTGFAYTIKTMSSNNYLDISECATNTIPDCLIHDASGDCALCNIGFTLDSGNTICTAIPAVTGCTTASFVPEQVQTISMTDSNQKYSYIFSSFIQNKFESVSSKKGCSECGTGNTLFGLPTEGSSFKCTDNSTLTGLTENCKIFSGTEANKCLECASTHILDTTDACVDKSTLASTVLVDGCKILDSSVTPNVCGTCMDGYDQNTSSFECLKYENCKTYIMDGVDLVCDICDAGYMVDKRDKTLCIDIIVPNCTKFETNCIECENEYILVILEDPAVTIDTTYCAKDLFLESELNQNTIITFSTGSALSDLSIDSLSPVDTDAKDDSTEASDIFTQSMCHSNMMPYCAVSIGNGYCTTCADGAWKDTDTLLCIPNSIDHCEVQTNLYECGTCIEEYFVNTIGQCQKQNVEGCSVYLPNLAGCNTCDDEHYLDTMKCYPYSVSNCKTYNPTSDECSICNDFYYQENGQCIAHTVSGCKDYSTTLDECANCHVRYYKETGQCKLNTSKNCLTYSLTTNACLTCNAPDSSTHENNFKLDGNGVHCVEFEEITGCVLYSTSTGDCDNCGDGYFTVNNECIPYPTGVCNCAVFASPTVCSQCKSDFFMDPATSTCQPIYRPIEHCVDYTSLTECKVCKTGYKLNATNTACELLTGVGCKDYVTNDSCGTCKASGYLKETLYMSSDGVNKIMECDYPLTNCLELTATQAFTEISDTAGNVRTTKTYSYTCQKCSSGFILNDDKTACITPVFINNCKDYSDDGLCVKCNPGSWLSPDKKKCTFEFVLEQSGCDEASFSTDITCNVCNFGYMMDTTGSCVECGGTGCAVCSADSSSSCDLCAAGYYMDSSKSCNKNENFSFSAEPENIEQSNTTSRVFNKIIEADEGEHEDDENFGMKISAMILGIVTLFIGLL